MEGRQDRSAGSVYDLSLYEVFAGTGAGFLISSIVVEAKVFVQGVRSFVRNRDDPAIHTVAALAAGWWRWPYDVLVDHLARRVHNQPLDLGTGARRVMTHAFETSLGDAAPYDPRLRPRCRMETLRGANRSAADRRLDDGPAPQGPQPRPRRRSQIAPRGDGQGDDDSRGGRESLPSGSEWSGCA